jgi:hypothetical protein
MCRRHVREGEDRLARQEQIVVAGDDLQHHLFGDAALTTHSLSHTASFVGLPEQSGDAR